MGAVPKTALNIACFPDDELDLAILAEILRGGADRVQLAGAVIAGGHTVRDTEIKYGLSVTGIVAPERLVTNAKARPGDALVLTKPLGTGFVTTAFKKGSCPPEVLGAAVASMIALNAGAAEAARTAGAHAATDITGFGLAGHAIEMAMSSGVTIEIDVGSLPLVAGAEKLAREGNRTRASGTNRAFAERTMEIEGSPDALRVEFLFDAQTSGGLLIAVPPDRAAELVERAAAAGARPHVVGRVRQRKGDVSLIVEP
jgi:selenide,water dikinase